MLPDPIERMEARIEDFAYEWFAGVPIGMIRCYGCRKIVPINEVESVSANPDAPAVCFSCIDEHYRLQRSPRPESEGAK